MVCYSQISRDPGLTVLLERADWPREKLLVSVITITFQQFFTDFI